MKHEEPWNIGGWNSTRQQKKKYPDFSATLKRACRDFVHPKKEHWKNISAKSAPLKKTSYFWLFWLPKKEIIFSSKFWVSVTLQQKIQFIKTRFKNAVRLIMIEISMYRRYNTSATRCNITSYIIYFWVMQGINTRRIIYKGLGWQI